MTKERWRYGALGLVCATVVLRWRQKRRTGRKRQDAQSAEAASRELAFEGAPLVEREYFDLEHFTGAENEKPPEADCEPMAEILFDDSVPVDPQRFFADFFSHPSEVASAWREQRTDTSDWEVKAWRWVSNVATRKVLYVVKTGNFMTPRANTIETQTVASRGDSWFVVDVKAETPNVPFGGSFFNRVRFIGQRSGPNLMQLCISADVVFTGGTGMLTGTIRSSSLKGMHKTYDMLQGLLSRTYGAPVAVAPPTPTEEPLGISQLLEGVAAGRLHPVLALLVVGVLLDLAFLNLAFMVLVYMYLRQ